MSRVRLKKYVFALACLVFGGLAISLTAIKSQAAEKVRVGLSAVSLPNAPMWIAEEKQIFKKYDIEPELIVVGGGATRSVSAVIAGDLQFATAGAARLSAPRSAARTSSWSRPAITKEFSAWSAFEERNLLKAGYHGPGDTFTNPLDDGSLDSYRVIRVPMTSLTKEATVPLGVKPRDAERSKNFFALGLVSWMYTRPTEPTLEWIDQRFAANELVAASNRAAFVAGYNFGETTEAVGHRFEVRPAHLPEGEYTSVTGNTALAWGIVAGGQLAKLPVTLGSYPITPASDILHELSKHKHFGVRTVQAEDEIAAVGMALGAAFAGHLGVTTTSGPGMALKSETVSLAVSLELPLLIVDIQRGGPSTGLPTKTEAADLNMAVFGRPSEAPLPVIAASSPVDCFAAAIEAIRIAVKYRTPVILLSDGFLANGSEPWRLPDIESLPDISVSFATEKNHVNEEGAEEFWPYLRDPRHSPVRGRSPGRPA